MFEVYDENFNKVRVYSVTTDNTCHTYFLVWNNLCREWSWELATKFKPLYE